MRLKLNFLIIKMSKRVTNCHICWQETTNYTAHLAEHGYREPAHSTTSIWAAGALNAATRWVQTPDDLVVYLQLDAVGAQIVRGAISGPFKLFAMMKYLRCPDKTEIHWVVHRGAVKIAYVGLAQLKFHYFKEPFGEIRKDGDLFNWKVADITGVAYSAQHARANMHVELYRKYGSYYPQYAEIKLALFAALPQPIAEEIDSIIAQTFNMRLILRDYASAAYISDRLHEIAPNKRWLPRDIPAGSIEWERIAAGCGDLH